jgi:phosphoribosylamine-glycine ligase
MHSCVALLMWSFSAAVLLPLLLRQDVTPGLLDYAVATCDPEVVAELLARQEDFPKVFLNYV